MHEANRKSSKPRLRIPDEKRRVLLSVRVLPATADYLSKMGYENCGRAIDAIVDKHQFRNRDQETLGVLRPTEGIATF